MEPALRNQQTNRTTGELERDAKLTLTPQTCNAEKTLQANYLLYHQFIQSGVFSSFPAPLQGHPPPASIMPLLPSRAMPVPRIVSLVPSVTELLCSLGLAPWIVGRTGFCVHPAEQVRSIPKVGGTKDVDMEAIIDLQPTHVLVNVDENPLAVARQLEALGLRVVVTHPRSPQDNLILVDQMAREFSNLSGLSARAAALKTQMRHALDSFGGSPLRPQRVLYLIWRDPWMTVARDTYISRMLDLIGWQTWPALSGGERGAARYPHIDLAQAARAPLDRVLLSSEPYRFGTSHLAEVQRLVPQARVQLVDGEALSWYGSRCLVGWDYLKSLVTADDLPGAAQSSR
jgi:hypothetical protein